jgi:GntP family gluconate:H+ symporter
MSAMITVTAFAAVIVLITLIIIRYHFPPFPVLVGAALLYGIAVGNAGTVAGEITGGIGAVFALLGIPIYSGAIIAQALRDGGFVPRIAADLAAFLRRPALASGFAGYLLSIPFMCCITPFILLSPIIDQFTTDLEGKKRLLYIAAFGSVVSFVLLFPLPVTLAVVEGAVSGPFRETVYAPLAVLISLSVLLLGIRAIGGKGISADPPGPHPVGISRTGAWLPIALPIVLILAGILLPGPGPLQSVSVALFAGAIAAILIVPEETRMHVLASGTKHAGIILLDICGAGALGGVVAASTFASDLVGAIAGYVPLILVPFILAAMVQTAQGSRVVTAVVSSAIIADTPVVLSVPPIPLVLMISAGTLVVSYVSDPYFWLIRRETEDSLTAMVRNYTLPLASAGVVIFVTGLLINLVS